MSGTLPHWLERLLGVPADATGEGTVWRLSHSWLFAPWVTLLAVAAIVALVAAIYWREIGSAGRIRRTLMALLRLAAIGLVLLMIGHWALDLNPTELPYLVLVLDDSQSMKIVDHYDDAALQADIASRVKQLGLPDASRLNQAKTLLLERDATMLHALDTRYKLRVYFCSDSARPQLGDFNQLRAAIRQLDPTGKSTRLGDDLRAILGDEGLSGVAAVVLMTDGITTDGQRLVGQAASPGDPSAADALRGETGAADLARAKGIPLFTVGLGSGEPPKDLELSDLRVPEVAFVDDILTFKFNLTSVGFAGREVEVRLREKGSDKVLARQAVALPPDHKPLEMILTHRPDKEGQYDFVVEVDRLPDEVRYDNNQIERQVSVRKSRIRVLLVQEYPSYEFRYLKNLLDRDSTVELHTLLQDADPQFAKEDTTALDVFPVRREDLFKYDVVILGDANPALLGNSAMANLADFVIQKGGGLVMIAGQKYNPLEYARTPLAPLVPIELATAKAPDPTLSISDGFTVQPTAEGLSDPNMQLGDTPAETAEIWRKLPPLYWLLESQKKETAEVLAVADGVGRRDGEGRRLPVILQRRAGSGMVLFHATDETWRWRYRVGDVFFARYWIQTIRYLSRAKLLGPDQKARLTTNRKQYSRGEPVRIRLELFDPGVSPLGGKGATVMLRRGERAERPIQLSRNPAHPELFEGTIDAPAEGSYTVSLIDPKLPGDGATNRPEPSASFQVKVSEVEFERTQMDAGELEGAALKTKGHFYTWHNADSLSDDLPAGRSAPQRSSSPPWELWNRWPVLMVLLLVLVAEWLLRKRSGMV